MKKIKFLVVTLVLFFCLIMNQSFYADAIGGALTYFDEEFQEAFSATILTNGVYFISEQGRSLTKDNFTGDLDYYIQAPGSEEIDYEKIAKEFKLDGEADIKTVGETFDYTFCPENIYEYGFHVIYVHSYAVFHTEHDIDRFTLIGLPRKAPNTNCSIAGNMTHLVDIAHPISIEEIKSRYHASDNVDGDITNRIQFQTNYDHQTLKSTGTYYIFLSVSDNAGHTTYAADLILVKDLMAPEIQLSKQEHILEVHTVFTLEDAKKFFTATDNLTPQSEILWTFEDNFKNQYNKLGTYTITATAKDKDNNACSKTLTIRVIDTTKPTLSLIVGGDSIIADHVLSNQEIKDLIQVSDNYDALSNSNIQIVENTCTGVQGKEYRIKVSIVDSSNNVGEKVFKYILLDTEAPTIMVEKTIYIPQGTILTNDQIIEMLKELGLVDAQSLSVSLTSSKSIDNEEGYEITYEEILKDGSKSEGKIKLQVFSQKNEPLEKINESKTNPWIYLLIVPIFLAIPVAFIKKNKYEKN